MDMIEFYHKNLCKKVHVHKSHDFRHNLHDSLRSGGHQQQNFIQIIQMEPLRIQMMLHGPINAALLIWHQPANRSTYPTF